MKKFVIDTSVIAKLFLEEEHRDIALDVFNQADQGEIELIAPILMWYELNNIFVKENLLIEEIQSHLSMLQNQVSCKNIRIIAPSQKLLKKSAQIANTDTQGLGYISSYDATFHALAVLRKATFLTADKKHYNKTKDLIGSVIMLEQFT